MSKFEDLLFCNQLSVERFVKFRIPNVSDAEDILQEVFLTAFKNFGQLKTEASFKAWIIGIARHKCNDYFRGKSKDLEIPIEELNEFGLSQTRFGYVENNTVSDVLEALGDKDKQILYLSYWKELPQTEIAARLGIPIGTVKSRLYTAKQNFKRIYPTNTYIRKVDDIMKKLPERLPEYKIEKSVEAPFSVKWEELWGLFIVPKISEKCIWGIYENETKKCSEWGEMEVVGKAIVHDIEGVEIKEYRHNHFGEGKDDADHYYVAQLTDNHCRILAENYVKNGVRKYLTFLDGDDFIAEWGYGENNCGKETNLTVKGKISEYVGKIIAENTNQLFDIVGRYTVAINGRKYDTVRVLSLDSYYGEYVCCEQYLDANGRTILWRRFNRDDWAIKRYKKKWSEQLPNNEQLIINGETYVHWYDCITDYIL
ncbi:MAG: RNA polymerase sigma factor [Clostridia bacterium]|nr:RNA polymerase sigma factor [Clostridia bacterium]